MFFSRLSIFTQCERFNKQSRAIIATLMLVFFGVTLAISTANATEAPTIAAAANIKFALDKIVSKFEQETGLSVRISYGSSGNFVSQIQHGAPFEMMLSADEFYIEQLHQAGYTQDAGVIYAIGRLALAAPKQSQMMLDEELIGLGQFITDGKLKRFAIANPEHAPYGERAQAVLKAKGLWDVIQPRLILGENASQAAQFTISGSTQGGIVPLSLVLAPQFMTLANYVVIPDHLYEPLNQRMALMPNASQTTTYFYQYIQSPQSQQILREFGFNLPNTASETVN